MYLWLCVIQGTILVFHKRFCQEWMHRVRRSRPVPHQTSTKVAAPLLADYDHATKLQPFFDPDPHRLQWPKRKDVVKTAVINPYQLQQAHHPTHPRWLYFSHLQLLLEKRMWKHPNVLVLVEGATELETDHLNNSIVFFSRATQSCHSYFLLQMCNFFCKVCTLISKATTLVIDLIVACCFSHTWLCI